MTKKMIKLSYMATLPWLIPAIERDIKTEFDVVVDNENPDYIIVGESIYGYSFEMHNFLCMIKRNPNAVVIFYTYESILPDFNFFDYVIARDNIEFGDRYMRYFYIYPNKSLLKRLSYDEAREELYNKKYFCNFIYSHGRGYFVRDLIFKKISEYKFVHSIGRYNKNCNIELNPPGANWYNDLINTKKMFKFSISAENCLYKDGVTEKLESSILAKTVPIYFGDSNINNQFNNKSFVNYHDYKNIDDMVERVKEIDSNDELWCEIISEPFMTKKQFLTLEHDVNKSREMFLNIFRQGIKDAKRLPKGLFIDNYRTGQNKKFSYLNKIDKAVNKLAWFIPIKKWRDSFKRKFI